MKKNKLFLALSFLTASILFTSCKTAPQETEATAAVEEETKYEISLAQWSLYRSFFGDALKGGDFQKFIQLLHTDPESLLQGELHPTDFPSIAKGYGVNTIELVNTFYYGHANDMPYWEAFKADCDAQDINVGLIMCDALGNLGDADSLARNAAVEKHHAWVDIAAYLGAHTIRVNAAGQGTEEEVAANAIDGLKKLGAYGASKGVNIVVENHGGYSSDGSWLAGVMKAVSMDNVGTLPDFGNFCIEKSADGCEKEYDRYKGIAELMPYAKGVSAKTHDFDADGNETESDFVKIFEIIKASGFKGTVGIEYEGNTLSEEEGIKATKALIEKVTM